MTIFMVLTVISFIILWVRQENMKEEFSNQTITPESWAYPSQQHGGLFNPVKVYDPISLQNHTAYDGNVSNNEVLSEISYQNEQIPDDIENFYGELLMTANSGNSEWIDEDSMMVGDVFQYSDLNMAHVEEQQYFEETIPEILEDDFFYQVRGSIDESISTLAPIQEFEVTTLSTNDWYLVEDEVHIDSSLSELADCFIASEQTGLQSWVVKVIGKEQNYLHVSDGTARIWLNVELFENKTFNHGDICFIEVERQEDCVRISTINILERDPNSYEHDALTFDYQQAYVS